MMLYNRYCQEKWLILRTPPGTVHRHNAIKTCGLHTLWCKDSHPHMSHLDATRRNNITVRCDVKLNDYSQNITYFFWNCKPREISLPYGRKISSIRVAGFKPSPSSLLLKGYGWRCCDSRVLSTYHCVVPGFQAFQIVCFGVVQPVPHHNIRLSGLSGHLTFNISVYNRFPIYWWRV